MARFAGSLEGVWPEGVNEPSLRLGLAVSGGPDSLALLLLGHAALPGRVEAATVDHRLREESAAEAADVSRICAELGVPHETLRVTVADGNVQAQAREARYAALADWMRRKDLAALATAHHADDQAETLLMRLNRASGVAGLAGARERTGVPGFPDRLLLRPLLGWRRSELGEVVAASGLDAAQDPSNLDDRFDRVRLRKALTEAGWLDVEAVAQSALHLAEADAALDWAAEREWRACVRREGLETIYRPQAPKAIVLRVLARLVAELDGEAARGGAIARLLSSLKRGQTASIGNLVARPMLRAWHFTKAPKRRN